MTCIIKAHTTFTKCVLSTYYVLGTVECTNNKENRQKTIIGKSNYNCGEYYIYPDIT